MPKKNRKSVALRPGVCVLCGIVNDDDYLGQLFTTTKITAHENCLLFSPLLIQELAPDVTQEGYLIGFKIDDIEREVRRILRLRCKVCHEFRAGVGCCNTSCKKSFHLCCGLNIGAMGIFKDCFQFYCSDHSVSQDLKTQISACKKAVPECTICLSSLIDEGYEELTDIKRSGNPWSQFSEKIKEKSVIHGKCCARCWVHRACMRQYGLSAGLHHTKCPNCGDNNKFIEEIQQNGIWLPDRDASWELTPGAYQELYENDVPAEEALNDGPAEEALDDVPAEEALNDVPAEEALNDHSEERISEKLIDLTISDDEHSNSTISLGVVIKVEPEDDTSHSQRLPRRCTSKIKQTPIALTSQIVSRKRKRPLEWSSIPSPTKPIKRKRKSINTDKDGVLVKKSCSKCSKSIVTLNCKTVLKKTNLSLLKDSNQNEAAIGSEVDYTCFSCSI